MNIFKNFIPCKSKTLNIKNRELMNPLIISSLKSRAKFTFKNIIVL